MQLILVTKTDLHAAIGTFLDDGCLAIVLTSDFSERHAVDTEGQTVWMFLFLLVQENLAWQYSAVMILAR